MRGWQHDADLVHRRRWLTLGVLCFGLLVIVVDNTILNVAIPTLARSRSAGGLGASASDLQWIVDAYVLVFAGLLLTAGSLGDRFGRYRFLAVGLSVFAVASGLAAMTDSIPALVAFRAVMGIGGACIMPATLSIITDVFRDRRERGRAIAVWAGIASLGMALGPVTGGLLLEHFWWGSVLLVNVPIAALALVGGFLVVPDSRDPSAPRVDLPGAVLSIVGVGTLLWGLIEGPSAGWRSTPVLGAFAVGLAVLGLFVLWERRTDPPMLDLRFFRDPRFSAASVGITFSYMAIMGMIFLFTQYLQTVKGFSPLKAGTLLVPMSAVMATLAPLSARWVERFGSKVVCGAGLIAVGLGLALQSALTDRTPTWVIVLGLVPLGIGMAHVMPTATASIMGAVPREKAGVGSATNDTTRQVGGAVGVALLGSIMASRYGGAVDGGLADAGLGRRLLDRIGTNVQAGVSIGRDTGGALGERIVAASQDAFLSGMRLAMIVAAVITLVAAAVVFRWLPSGPTLRTSLTAAGPGPGVPDVEPAPAPASL